MTQRTTAGLAAVLLLGALVAWVVFRPMPYVTYEPGTTLDVLGQTDGKEIIQVTGHKVYRDDGELRMTTVLVSTEPRRSFTPSTSEPSVTPVAENKTSPAARSSRA